MLLAAADDNTISLTLHGGGLVAATLIAIVFAIALAVILTHWE